MSQSVQVVRSAILFGVVALALAGCGTGDSGPSSSTVKRLAANASYTDFLKLCAYRMQMEKFSSQPSQVYLKTKAVMEKLEKHKAHYVRKIEDNMHEKGCTKVSGGKYNCSVVVENPKTHSKKAFIVTIDKAGRVWTLSKMSPAKA
jgi:hypothetical protein